MNSALTWHEGTLGPAAQTNVVVFDLATRGPSNRVRKNLFCLDMSNNSDTTNGSIRGPKAIWVAEGLLAPLKVLQIKTFAHCRCRRAAYMPVSWTLAQRRWTNIH